MIRKLLCNYCQDCQDCQDCQECQDFQACKDCRYYEVSISKKNRVNEPEDQGKSFFKTNFLVLTQEEFLKEFFIEHFQKKKSSVLEQNKVFERILDGKLIMRPYYLQNPRLNNLVQFPANPSGTHIVDLYFNNNPTFTIFPKSPLQKIESKKVPHELHLPKKYEFGYWYMFNNPNLEIFRCNWESMISEYDRRDWFRLSSCPGAVNLLKKNINKVHVMELCRNPSSEAMKLLKSIESYNDFHDYSYYSDHEKWEFLFENPFAEPILRENLSKINWLSLTRNKSKEAMNLVQEYFFLLMLQNEYVIEESLSNLSENEFAVSFLEQNSDYIDWTRLSKNPKAIHLLKENTEKIDWLNLALNPGAIDLLEENIDKFIIKKQLPQISVASDSDTSDLDADIYLEHRFIKRFWINLCFNPRATRILAKHLDSIDIEFESVFPFIEDLGHQMCSVAVEHFQDSFKDWTPLLTNPNIVHVLFPLDLEKIYLNSFHLHQELIAKVMCPQRISNLSKTYGVPVVYYFALYNI